MIEMGIEIEAYYKILSKAQGGRLLSLDENSGEETTPLLSKLTSSAPSPFDEVKGRELKAIIAKALSTLTEKNRLQNGNHLLTKH